MISKGIFSAWFIKLIKSEHFVTPHMLYNVINVGVSTSCSMGTCVIDLITLLCDIRLSALYTSLHYSGIYMLAIVVYFITLLTNIRLRALNILLHYLMIYACERCIFHYISQ